MHKKYQGNALYHIILIYTSTDRDSYTLTAEVRNNQQRGNPNLKDRDRSSRSFALTTPWQASFLVFFLCDRQHEEEHPAANANHPVSSSIAPGLRWNEGSSTLKKDFSRNATFLDCRSPVRARRSEKEKIYRGIIWREKKQDRVFARSLR